MQGRTNEARSILQPALAYYQQEQAAGAGETSFRGDYAYALYVHALTFTGDQAKREAALDQAASLVAGASTEARALSDMRALSGAITVAREPKHG
jgi:hypothetical protein